MLISSEGNGVFVPSHKCAWGSFVPGEVDSHCGDTQTSERLRAAFLFGVSGLLLKVDSQLVIRFAPLKHPPELSNDECGLALALKFFEKQRRS